MTEQKPYALRLTGGPAGGTRHTPGHLRPGDPPPPFLTVAVRLVDNAANEIAAQEYRYDLEDHVKYPTGREVAWYGLAVPEQD